MINVFLVDDHEVVRRGIADLLTVDPELAVIGELRRIRRRWLGSRHSNPTLPCSMSGCPTATASNCVVNCSPGCRACIV